MTHEDFADLPTGVRYEQVKMLVLATERGDSTLTTSWIADRLAEIPASYDEYLAVREREATRVSIPEADTERMVVQALRSERRAAAAADGWLERAREDADFDWAGVARLVDADEDVLRRRAGAPINGKLPRVNVRGGLPMSAAAAALGISRATLYQWIEKGKVDQVVLDGRKVIATDANGKPIVR
ncbi:hypothetical protein [Microbacterium lacticum]|uniref:Excisionase family DNA binding protein n=1 Tax=Microbacterium lacticum TaxID=33885 RepID=A0A4Y3ULX5_9MICO|nr:hypothetical protein [Microbacterium lacticum]TQM90957.1 hypothetical protein FHX68_2811 [Microbacterium lacticum]GEB95172.1 hypothetical protein MLA01_13910 [Microbacterium lacticum]GGN23222.1 hypothetical protein GCM10009724_16960 [Microbacterium lacticum]